MKGFTHTSPKLRKSERGNVFFTLFGAVAVVGVLGAGIMATMRGPLSTMVEVNRRTQAEAEMSIASKMALLEATQAAQEGDCDLDGFVEPLEYKDAGASDAPVGGGYLPDAVGTNKEDPWGIQYGYCAWDSGPTVDDAGCGGAGQLRLDGEGNAEEDYTIIAVISAGPDQVFQTTCTGGDPSSVSKVAGSDDIISQFDYAAASAATGGLWNIKSQFPDIAEIDKNIEVKGTAKFQDGIDLSDTGFSPSASLRLGASSMFLPTEAEALNTSCDDAGDTANHGILRINTVADPDTVEICDSNSTTWQPVSAGSSIWTIKGDSEIYYTAANVGVGTGMTDPTEALDVVGNIKGSGNADLAGDVQLENGNSVVWDSGADITENGGDLELNASTNIAGDVTITGTIPAGLNDDMLIVQDNGGTDVLVVEHAGQVGIGDSDPNDALSVAGSVDATDGYRIEGAMMLNIPNGVSGSVLLGADAGTAVTGDGNTIIGARAATTLTSGTDNIVIGTGSTSADVPTGATSNYLNIGRSIHGDLANKRVGIGFADNVDVSTFDATLEVNGETDITGGGLDVEDSIVSTTGDITATAGDVLATAGDIRGVDVYVTNEFRIGTPGVGNYDVFGPPGSCATGNFHRWDGDEWVCEPDSGGGGGGGSETLEETLTAGNDAEGLNALDFNQVGSDEFCNADLTICFDPEAVGNGTSGVFVVESNVVKPNSSTVDETQADFVFGSLQLDDDTNFLHDKRMFFNKGKGAFRAGNVLGSQWNDSNTGYYSFATGVNTEASGNSAVAMGNSGIASGIYSITLGAEVMVGNGTPLSGFGNYSMGIGLGEMGGTSATWPRVTGNSSFGVFMGDQENKDLQEDNTFALIGGTMVIDATSANPAASTGGEANLTLDVEGAIGAQQYCDEAGDDCFDAADVAAGSNVFEVNANVVRGVSGTVDYSTDDFVFGSYQLDDTTTGNEDARFYFDKSKAAFRAGSTAGSSWDDANVGTDSMAWGRNTQASNNRATAWGTNTTASGVNSTAFGSSTWATANHSTALGTEVRAMGDFSIAFGLFDDTQATDPRVTGNRSVGIFMGTGADSQSAVDVTASDTFALLGGTMVIDPAQPATELAASTGGEQDLELDVEGDIGAINYCDEDGDDCFSASDVGGINSAVFEVDTNVIRGISGVVDYSADDFVIGSPQLDDSSDADHDKRMFFDKSKGAFRAGQTFATQWDDGSVGSFSTAFGSNTQATNNAAMAWGNANSGTVAATGSSSTAFGYGILGSITATGAGSTAFGHSSSGAIAALGAGSLARGYTSTGAITASGAGATAWGEGSTGNITASGIGATAFGRDVIAGSGTAGDGDGDYSVAIGLGDATGVNFPKVTGTGTMAVFLGDQNGKDVQADDTLAIVGGSVIIDGTNANPAASTSGESDLLVDVEGALGAQEYCDEDGDNCFTVTELGTGIFERSGTVVRGTSGTVDYSTDDFVFGSYQLDDTTTGNEDARMFFDKSKAAFRAGQVDGAQWDDGNIGTGSVAFGINTTAAGDYSIVAGSNSSSDASSPNSVVLGTNLSTAQSSVIVIGTNTSATKVNSTSIGHFASVSGSRSTALGYDVRVSGDESFGFSAYNVTGATYPEVSGNNSGAFFFDDQTNADITAANNFAILGASVVIDAVSPSTTNGASTGGEYDLVLDVEGPAGARYYCDEDGNNCFAAGDVADAAVFEVNANVVRGVSGTVDYSTDDFVFGSYQLDDTTDTNHDARMFFDKSKGAFRAGVPFGTEWDDASIGNYSFAFGGNIVGAVPAPQASGDYTGAWGGNTTASGDYATAFGNSNVASGSASTAWGITATAAGPYSTAFGSEVSVGATGTASVAVGMGDSSGPFPTVTGANAMGLFMGNQTGSDVSTARTLALLGGTMIIDPGTPATEMAASTGGDQDLELDVEGDIGAINYCDEDGNTCFTAATVAGLSAGTGVFEMSGSVVRGTSGTVDYSTDDFVFGSYQLDDTTDSDHDKRMFFDKSKAAFRAGTASGAEWDEASLGTGSAGFGAGSTVSGDYSLGTGNATVSGGYSLGFGRNTTASGNYSFAGGGGSIASGTNSIALGDTVQASGIDSVAFGEEAIAGSGTAGDGNGDNSFVIGLQSASQATDPTITGDRSMVLYFDGNTANANSGYVFADSDKFALIGGEFQIDNQSSTANKGCIKYDSATSKLQFSNDCGTAVIPTYSDFGSGSGVFEVDSNVIRGTSGTVDYSADDFVVGSYQLDDTTDSDHDSRMFFDKSQGAFRAGTVAADQWDSGNLGLNSFAAGQNTTASGDVSAAFGSGNTANANTTMVWGASNTASQIAATAWGVSTLASGTGATAWGLNTIASDSYSTAFGQAVDALGIGSIAMGREVRVGDGVTLGSGSYSVAIGLGNSFLDPTLPVITGQGTLGIFMQDQDNVDVTTNNIMAILGGPVIVDPASPATELAPSTGGEQDLALDVEGAIGAQNYCDEDGDNCFTAAEASPSSDLFLLESNVVLPNSSVVTLSSDDFVFGSYQLADTGSTNHDKRMYFDKSLAAFRAGAATSNQWNSVGANVGAYSTAFGLDNKATNTYDMVWGAYNTASGQASTAFGSGNTASGLGSTAFGILTTATQQGATAWGSGADATATYATAWGTNTLASEANATAFGNAVTADGNDSVAIGYELVVGRTGGPIIGDEGDRSIGFSAGNSSTGTYPKMEATGSIGFFVGDQNGVNFNTDSAYGFFGGNIVIDPATPATQTAPRATLDIGAATDAIILPSGSTAQRPGTPANGMIRFSTSVRDYEAYNSFHGGWNILSPWKGNTATEIYFDPSGSPEVGINMSSPDVELDVDGDIEYTGTIADVSDIRLKKDIKPLDDRGSMLDKLGQLGTYSFVMIDDPEERTEFGVIAQELEKVFPELVKTADDEIGTKNANYVGLIAPMIKATQELKAENDALKAEISDLKSDRAEIHDAVLDLTKQVELLNKAAGNNTSKASFDIWTILMMLGMFGASSAFFFVSGRKRSQKS